MIDVVSGYKQQVNTITVQVNIIIGYWMPRGCGSFLQYLCQERVTHVTSDYLRWTVDT